MSRPEAVSTKKGQIMAKKRYYDGHYAGMDSRKSMEGNDSGMISSDYSSMANMPYNVIMKEYPKYGYGSYEGLNDTSRGIDYQMMQDSKKKKKETFPEKY